MNEKVANALSYVDEKYVSAAAKRKKNKRILPMAAAAILAIAFLFNMPAIPMIVTAHAVATASESRVAERPNQKDYENNDAWYAALDQWQVERTANSDTAKQAAAELTDFFTAGSAQFLTAEGSENRLWSPVNAYIGLAMLAELTEGDSRDQILDLLGTADTDTLRQQVNAVWESVYHNNKSVEMSVLANSLWLNKGLSYQQQAMDNLAYYHHASVYQDNLGTQKANRAISAWVNNNTGGFVKNAADSIELPPETVLALYSTIYFQSKWVNEFSAKNNTDDVFHAPNGDVTVTFMNKKLATMYYYWGDKFSAVRMGLENGSSMWFILPDEGCTTADVLADGQYMQMLQQQGWENKKEMMVNLSVPQFDVSSTADLRSGLQQLGVTDVFSLGSADFSAITDDTPVYLAAANQSVRVQIDEEGVKAAAYIEFIGAGSAAPPDEIIDFVVDRPFIFAVTKSSIPLFMGTVNQP